MRALFCGLALAIGVAGSALAAPPDGKYTVMFPECGRPTIAPGAYLTVTQGQLTGTVAGRQTQTLTGVVLKPDGSFTATTTGGNAAAEPWAVSGQFTGNSVSVTLTTPFCGTHTAQGTRAGG